MAALMAVIEADAVLVNVKCATGNSIHVGNVLGHIIFKNIEGMPVSHKRTFVSVAFHVS